MADLVQLGRQLAEYFSFRPEVLAVYVFGSVAAGRERPGSDVDIAVLLQSARNLDRKALLDQWLPDLCRLLRRDVDILVLNDASDVARMQVFRRGRLVLAVDPGQLARFRMTSLVQYLDFLPHLRRMQARLMDRFASHGG
ncbi:MAG: nucleotidyltransferase domain-containing protein [Thermodesulfobacteriota bacterium]